MCGAPTVCSASTLVAKCRRAGSNPFPVQNQHWNRRVRCRGGCVGNSTEPCDWRQAGPDVLVFGAEVICSAAAHRVPHQVNAIGINRVLLTNSRERRHRIQFGELATEYLLPPGLDEPLAANGPKRMPQSAVTL